MTNERSEFWLCAAICLPLILRFILPDAGWATGAELVAMILCVGAVFFTK